MGTAAEAVPDLGDALILLIIGVTVMVLSASQVWAAVRHHAIYGLGGLGYGDSAADNPAAFWGQLLLLLGATAIGAWVAAQAITDLIAA